MKATTFYLPQPDWLRRLWFVGAFGVDLFFVLSAYLITTLLLREEAAYGRIDLWAFWTRRALRIWPLYALYLVLVASWQGISGTALIAHALFVAN